MSEFIISNYANNTKGYNTVVNGIENKHQTYNGKEHKESLNLNVI